MGCSNSSMNHTQTPRSAPTLMREKTGFVAFQIDLQNNETKDLNKDIDKILAKPLPKRLQRLEPLDGATKLTSEDLQKKLQMAEFKRQKTFERKLEFTRRGSVRRSIVLNSQEDDSTIDPKLVKEKQPFAEKLSEQKLSQMVGRQRMQKEFVESQRQQVIKAKDEGVTDLNLNIINRDNDDNSSTDSWSDIGNQSKTKKEKIDSNQDSSGYSSRNVSASKLATNDISTKLNLPIDKDNDEFDLVTAELKDESHEPTPKNGIIN